MTKSKRILSVVLSALMLVFTCMTYVPASAAETADPVIAFVGIEHSPLVVGDTETFTVTTLNADKVQYQISLKDAAGKVEDLTNGYTAAVDGAVPYAITPAKQFALGKYSLVISAKRVSDNKIATYTANVNCVSKDDANRIYANGAVQIDKTNYTLGDKITVNGIANLGGIQGPYKYKLHVYNATTNVWTKNVQATYGDKIEWTPSAPGTYVLDIYVNSEKSTTWKKYAANPASEDTYGTYEAWKLLVVTVADTFKVTSVNAINATQLLVNFNKPVLEADAELTARYHIGSATVNSAVMQDDTKSVLLTLAAPLTGTNLYVVDPVKLAADTTVTTPIYTFVETYSDTVAPTVTKVEYPVYNQAKVTFSEPMSALGNVTATQNGATVALPEVAGATTFAAGKSAVYYDLSGLAADKPITVVMVGAKDQNNNLINPNPTTLTFTMTKTDTTAPTVVEVKALSDTRVSVKFSEKLKENPSATVNGALNGMTWATDDNITYTATFNSQAGVAVFAVTKATDVSGNVNYDVTPYSKLLQLTQDTTAPVLASSVLKTFNNKQYLVLTFNEDVTAVGGGNITGTYVKDYVTMAMTPVATVLNTNLFAYAKAITGADDSKSVMIDVTAFDSANYTLTIPAGIVKDLASTPVANAAFTVALTKGTLTVSDSSAPYVGVDTNSDTVLDKFVTFGTNNEYFEVYFSENMDPATALNVNNYRVGGACIFSNAILNGDAKTVRLTVTPGTIVYGGDYAVSVSGVKDSAGNVMTAFSKTFTLKENVKPYIASAKLTANNKIEVTMSEAVTGLDTTATDFEVYVAGTKLTATTDYTVNYSAGVTTITLINGKQIDDLTKTVQVKLVDTTVADNNANLAVTGTLVTVTP